MTTATVTTARRLLERDHEHPVVSLLFDLDPEEFAAVPARQTQLRSLIDEGRKWLGDAGDALSHDDRQAVVQDLDRLEEFLQSDDAPFQGARALAVFCSTRDDLLEVVQLSHPVSPRIVVGRTPFVEPLVAGEAGGHWCVTLVSRNIGRIFAGEAPGIPERVHRDDDVHGQHRQGGWSQPRYERSYEGEVDSHLRAIAEELYRLWQHEGFDRLFLGGPEEIVARFAAALHNDLRPLLADTRVSVDAEVAGPADVRAAVSRLLEQTVAARRQQAVDQLQERLQAGSRAAVGTEPVLNALNERRVETLVLALNFQAAGTRCPACGLLYPVGTTSCPADGTAVDPVDDLREAAVEAAVLQDADVVVVGEGSEVPPSVLIRGGGIGALLRF